MVGESVKSLPIQGEFPIFAAEFPDRLSNDIDTVRGMVQQTVAFRSEPRIRTEDKPLTAKVPDYFLFQEF